jgi:hypothetical protein
VPEDQRVAQGRVIPPLLGGEADQVEAARPRLDQVSDRAGPAADLADLVAAVRASAQTGTSPALRTPYQARTAPSRLVTWNSTGSPGTSPSPASPAARTVRALIELAVGHPAVERHDGLTPRVHGRHGVQLVGDGAGAPQARPPVAARQVAG